MDKYGYIVTETILLVRESVALSQFAILEILVYSVD